MIKRENDETICLGHCRYDDGYTNRDAEQLAIRSCIDIPTRWYWVLTLVLFILLAELVTSPIGNRRNLGRSSSLR